MSSPRGGFRQSVRGPQRRSTHTHSTSLQPATEIRTAAAFPATVPYTRIHSAARAGVRVRSDTVHCTQLTTVSVEPVGGVDVIRLRRSAAPSMLLYLFAAETGDG